jgi:hypothetical protein
MPVWPVPRIRRGGLEEKIDKGLDARKNHAAVFLLVLDAVQFTRPMVRLRFACV